MANPPPKAPPEKQGDNQRRPSEQPPHPNAQTWQNDIGGIDGFRQLNERLRQGAFSPDSKSNNGSTDNAFADSGAKKAAKGDGSKADGTKYDGSKPETNKSKSEQPATYAVREKLDPTKLLDKNKQSDKQKEIPLGKDAQQAKDEFVRNLEGRFKDDPRLGDLKAMLPKLDQRILNEKVQKGDGSHFDPQQELADSYRGLNEIATKAESLTFKDKKGVEHQVNNASKVNDMLADGIKRTASPEIHDQGANNTCAAQSGAREGMVVRPSKVINAVASAVTTGKFENTDFKTGEKFTSTIHKPSLSRACAEGQNFSLSRQNKVGPFGAAESMVMGQLAQDVIARNEGHAAGTYSYRKGAPTRQSDTGEKVVYSATGKQVYSDRDTGKTTTDRSRGVAVNHPRFDDQTFKDTKQTLFGQDIASNYAEATTISDNFQSGSQVRNQLQDNANKGWRMSTAITFVDHYVKNANGLGGAHGRHAFGVGLANNGSSVNVYNNWGGSHDKTNLSADKLASWTQMPTQQLAMNIPRGERGGGHFINPDVDYTRPQNKNLPADDKKQRPLQEEKKDEDTKEMLAREQKEERIQEERLKNEQNARGELAQLEAEIAAANGDPSKLNSLRSAETILRNKLT